jgi:hypothetical protein
MLDGRFLDGSVHPLDLPISPRMIDFGQAVFDSMFLANAIEEMLESPSILEAVGKLNALALQTAMEVGASQIRNTRLERIEAIVERKQRALMKSKEHGLLLCGEDG